MPRSGSAAGGNFFVAWARELREAPEPERDEPARERDDDRVLDAMRPRYPRGVTASGGDTRDPLVEAAVAVASVVEASVVEALLVEELVVKQSVVEESVVEQLVVEGIRGCVVIGNRRLDA